MSDMGAAFLDVAPIPFGGIGLGELFIIGTICCLITAPLIAVVGIMLYSAKKKRGRG